MAMAEKGVELVFRISKSKKEAMIGFGFDLAFLNTPHSCTLGIVSFSQESHIHKVSACDRN